jgi:hypothetical protein
LKLVVWRPFKYCHWYGKQIVKGIDAVTRDQLVQIMSVLGVGNAAPVFSMVPAFGPFKPAALLPTTTEEDKVILNNVQKVVEFLTAGSSRSRTPDQVLKPLSSCHGGPFLRYKCFSLRLLLSLAIFLSQQGVDVHSLVFFI